MFRNDLSDRRSRSQRTRRRNRTRLLRSEQLEQRMLLCIAAGGEIKFETSLESLNLTGGPYPISLASDPTNALGDSVDGYGFVDSEVTLTLSSQRTVDPGPATLGEACAFPDVLPLSSQDPAALVGNLDPIDPEQLDGQLFFVDSFFDVFFDITVTDVDSRPGRDYAGQADGASIQLINNGPTNIQSFYQMTFDKDAPNFGLFPPPQHAPFIGFFAVEIPLGADINGNAENDKIKFTIGSIVAGDANRTFTTLPNGTVINEFDAAGYFAGAVVDESTDPPFTLGAGSPGAPAFSGPGALTGPTTATSTLLNPVISSAPVVYFSSDNNGSVGGVNFADDDIFAQDTATGNWSLVFDGSDVGVYGDVNAFHILPNNDILMSFKASSVLPGLGSVRPEDIVRFTPTTLGDHTSGSFVMELDGSTVGLTSYSENIDAIALDPAGNLVISTTGNFRVPGVSGRDRDLIVRDGGSWASYLPGSTIGLRYSRHDIAGAWLDDTGYAYLNTLGSLSSSIGRADIFDQSGAEYYDGQSNGIGNQPIDGIFIQFPDPPDPDLTSAGGEGNDPVTPLSIADLTVVADAAIDRWMDAGISVAQAALLNQVTFEIVDLGGALLGTASGTTVQIDINAAGRGWFVDSTPLDDSEFDASGTATSDAAVGRTDLLTAVMHELGHVLGLGHHGGLMSTALATGTRHNIDDDLLDLLAS